MRLPFYQLGINSSIHSYRDASGVYSFWINQIFQEDQMAVPEKVCAVSDIADGAMKVFTVGGKEILVANVGGIFHAVQAKCPHMKANLVKGKIENGVLICPMHGARFDLTTGKLMKDVSWLISKLTFHGAKDIESFAVTVDGNDLKVTV